MIRWYLCDVTKTVFPASTFGLAQDLVRYSCTVDRYVTHNAKYTDEAGVVHNVPMTTAKYEQPWSALFNADAPDCTVALVRLEDGELDSADYARELLTQADWDEVVAQYPRFAGAFLDQPYYPARG